MTVFSLSIVAVPTAKAAASAGDLVKISGSSAVYYLGANSKRYVFPNEATYYSWYKDFSGVVTIPQAEMESYILAANVTIRPGTYLVKSPSIATVYAISTGGVLQSIVSEANAAALWGANWNKNIIDLEDSIFTNYSPKIGSALAVGQYPDGSLIKTSGSADVFLLSAGKARKFASEAAFLANGFKMSFVNTVPSTYTWPSAGADITGMEDTLSDTSQGGSVATGPVSSGSGLAAVLGSDTPASQTIPAGVSKIELMKFNLTAANDGDVIVNSVVITRTGLGVASDFPSLWLEQAGTRLTSTKSINTSNQAILTLSPALTIPAGKTVSLSVFGSVGDNPGANDVLSITAASDISASGATVSGSFPISSNLMSFTTSYKVNQVVVDSMGGANSYNVGDQDVSVASFSLADVAAVGASGTRDLVFKSITLKNTGNADLATVVSNLALEKSGVKVSESATVSGKYVTFVLANGGLTITKGDNATFKVTGDIINKDTSNDTIQFMVNKSSDLNAVEAATGYAATVTTNSTTGFFSNTDATFTVTTLTSGSINLAKEATSPTAKSVVKNTKDVVVLLANLKANQAFNADGMNLDLVNDVSTVDQFSNIRLFVNGVLVDSKDGFVATVSTDPVGKVLNYDSSVSINQGNNEIKVLADVNSDATTGATITAQLTAIAPVAGTIHLFTSPIYANDNNVLAGDIGGTATAGKITIAAANLTATRSDGFSSPKTLVKGTTDVILGNFTLKALNDAITVNSISLSGNDSAVPTLLTASHVSAIKLLVNGQQVGGTKNLSASGATFNLGSDAFTVAKDTTRVVQVLATFDSSSETARTFSTTLTFNGVDSNGKDLTGTAIPTAQTVRFAVAASGTLAVAKDGDSTVAALLSANSGNNEIAKFKFTATNDDLKINKIYISNVNGSGSDSRISAIDIYNGTALLGTAVPTNGEVFYDLSSNPVIVAASTSVVLTAKVELNNITEAGQSGKHIELAITGIEADSSSGAELLAATNTLAYDDASAFTDTTKNLSAAITTATATTLTVDNGTYAAGTVIMVNSEQMMITTGGTGVTSLTVTRGINGTTATTHSNLADIFSMSSMPANDFIVYKTVPTISLQALPSTILTTGDQTVMKFTVAADQNADVTIDSIVTSMTASGVALSSTAGSLKVNGSNYPAASVAVTADNTNPTKVTVDLRASNGKTPIVVAAGTSKTIEIVLNVSTVTTTNGATASLTSKIAQDATGSYSYGSSSFGWSDNADVANYVSTLANSFEVSGLPTNTQSLTTN